MVTAHDIGFSDVDRGEAEQLLAAPSTLRPI